MTVPPNDDEVFRQIVASFGEEAADPVPRWPVSEDVGESAPPTEELGPRDVPPLTDAPLPEWLEPAALEDEGHYVPPEPPRLPRVRLRTISAVLLIVLGFAVLFVPYDLHLDDSTGSLLLGMVLIGSGAALLIGSLRDTPGPEEGPDDGAVV